MVRGMECVTGLCSTTFRVVLAILIKFVGIVAGAAACVGWAIASCGKRNTGTERESSACTRVTGTTNASAIGAQ